MTKNTTCECFSPPGGGTTCPSNSIAYCRKLSGQCFGNCIPVPPPIARLDEKNLRLTLGWFILLNAFMNEDGQSNFAPPGIDEVDALPSIPNVFIDFLNNRKSNRLTFRGERKFMKFSLPEIYKDLKWHKSYEGISDQQAMNQALDRFRNEEGGQENDGFIEMGF